MTVEDGIALVSHESRADIGPTGASLRALTLDSIPVVPPYPAGPPPLSAGVVLVPWPDRVEGATWSHRGEPQRLDVTEPARGHAIHGLLADHAFAEAARTDDGVRLEARIDHAPGYPFELDVAVDYRLGPRSLVATLEVTNRGHDAAPVATGSHPYFRIDDAPLDEHVLTIDAREEVVLDERLIPRGLRDVAGTPADFRNGRAIGRGELHRALTGLPPGGAVHSLSARGTTLEVWADEDFGVVQVFVATGFPGGPAIAIEPLTAAANALRTGERLRWLSPGESWTPSWGARLA